MANLAYRGVIRYYEREVGTENLIKVQHKDHRKRSMRPEVV